MSKTCWLVLAAVVISGMISGCSVSREPMVSINPNYSIMRDTPALETWAARPTRTTNTVMASLPDVP